MTHDHRKTPRERPEHFAPELIQLLRRALLSPVQLKIENKRTAYRFRARLYQLRRVLEANNHPLAAEFARLKFSVEQIDENGKPVYILDIDSKDDELVEIIKSQISDLDADEIEDEDEDENEDDEELGLDKLRAGGYIISSSPEAEEDGEE